MKIKFEIELEAKEILEIKRELKKEREEEKEKREEEKEIENILSNIKQKSENLHIVPFEEILKKALGNSL